MASSLLGVAGRVTRGVGGLRLEGTMGDVWRREEARGVLC